MHLSDTLVLGPLPLGRHAVRIPLGAALAGVLGLLLAGAAALLTLGPLPAPITTLAGHLPVTLPGRAPATAPAAPAVPVPVASVPAGATILLDGQVLGTTPATIAVPLGHLLVLRRAGAPDVTLLEAHTDVAIPVWPAPTVLPVRAPVPGGAVTDLQLLADGRLALAIASAATPTERQAWLLDPARAHLERVGPATRDDVPPAGVVVAPDGQRRVALVRGAAATPTTPATADVLLLDGPEGRRPLLPEDVLARDERVRDLSWAPDSQSALLVSQRPVGGTTRVRLRHLTLAGPPRDLVDLPVAPLEGSWVWAPDGHAVAFLVRTTPPVLATLDLADGALRSVADLPAGLLPSAGTLAPASWSADGTLLFVAPRPEDDPPPVTAPTPAAGSPRPLPRARLQLLAAGRSDPRPLGDAPILATAPTQGSDGTLLALGRAPDGGLLLRTLDLRGHLLAEQPLGVSAPGPVAVRWDLAHAQLVVLQAAVAGGIHARVLRFDGAPGPQEVRP